jgi:hypothetical protein
VTFQINLCPDKTEENIISYHEMQHGLPTSQRILVLGYLIHYHQTRLIILSVIHFNIFSQNTSLAFPVKNYTVHQVRTVAAQMV